MIESKVGLCITSVCRAFGFSRQSYYKWETKRANRIFFEAEIILEVKNIRKSQPKVGCRKLQKMLEPRGFVVGRDSLFEILRVNKLLIRNKRNYVRTTDSNHLYRKYNNLIKDREFKEKERVFVSDITYIKTREGFKYLSLISDKVSRKIMGYYLSENLTVEGSLKALKMALKQVKEPSNLIHHSDRGIQYCCYAYTNYLKDKNVQISMTEKDHVYENAQAERVNGILKNELLLQTKFFSYKEAKKAISEAITIYNNERLHLSLNYLTPTRVHEFESSSKAV